MRPFAPFFALCVLFATPAFAQDAPSDADAIAHASRGMAAIWRPITATTPTSMSAACNGALDDLEALDTAMPEDFGARSLAAVHVQHGLAAVPAETPGVVFFFPDTTMSWFASGAATISAADDDTGQITVQDAAGRAIQIQLGHAASQALMRVQAPGGEFITFVGCASTLRPPANAAQATP